MTPETIRHFRRAVFWQLPWLIGGSVSLIAGSFFYSIPLFAMMWLPVVAGLPAGSIAFFVSGQRQPISRGTRLVFLAVAVFPLALALTITAPLAPVLGLIPLVAQIAIVLLSGGAAFYVMAKLCRRTRPNSGSTQTN